MVARRDPSAAQIGQKWDQIYRRRASAEPMAALVVRRFCHLLPTAGVALDLACGLGGNALFLARHGMKVHAWDISTVAVDRLKDTVASDKLDVQAEVRDVETVPFPREAFDVITVSRFLCRAIAVPLMAALRPAGLLYYQTFTRARVRPGGPANADFLLQTNELLSLFAPLTVLAYREEGLVGDCTKGLRDEAMLVGQKNPSDSGAAGVFQAGD